MEFSKLACSPTALIGSTTMHTLFPAPEERARIDDLLTRFLRDAQGRVAAGRVTPTIDLQRFRRELSAFSFRKPVPLEAVLEWIVGCMETGIVHVTNRRYFGLFNPAPTFPSQCADRIAAIFNPQLATSTTSPVPVDVEAHVISSVARRAGLHRAATGHFTTGGGEANLTGLICALTRAEPGFATDGVRAFSGSPTFYASNESHLAWLKMAHQCGIGRSALRLVPTDGRGRMSSHALSEAINADRARGHVPVMIAATAGTTNAGMIDPLVGCGELARAHGLWYHVDAAWGGAAIASDRLRPLLDGIEHADSVTIDAHKWLATTMGCGMFLTQDPAILSSAFRVSTTYMPSNIDHIDPYVTTLQWSRRFLGLRMFLSLAAAGWDGYAEHVLHSTDMSRSLAEKLQLRGWEVVNESPLAVLCLLPPAGSAGVRSIVDRVLASGQAWISIATYEGREVIRTCVTHGQTMQDDVDILVGALETAAQSQA